MHWLMHSGGVHVVPRDVLPDVMNAQHNYDDEKQSDSRRLTFYPRQIQVQGCIGGNAQERERTVNAKAGVKNAAPPPACSGTSSCFLQS